MIDWLPEDLPPHFPNTSSAQLEPNGLLAAGGKLSPPWIVSAYKKGIFPWFDDESPILWWSPAPRMMLKAQDFHISRSLIKFMKKTDYRITCNQAFEEVIIQCSLPRKGCPETWITEDIIDAYAQLNSNGICHSVECWSNDGNLIGGLYGIQINGVFYGESMFSRESNASKMAFGCFARHLFSSGVAIIDCQMHSNHMEQFGAKEVPRHEFEEAMTLAIKASIRTKPPKLLF